MSLLDRLQTRDLAAQQRQLTAAHVKYVVLHRPEGALFHWTRADGDPDRYAHTYSKAGEDPHLMVLRVY
jgi:hypothetical protein